MSLYEIVSFETRNLCTFLLGLFRSIVSSLVNDYYLISFLFQSVHMYQVMSHLRYFFFFFDTYIDLFLAFSSLYNRFIVVN